MKDIEKRLLPAYWIQLKQEKIVQRQEDERDTNQKQAVQKLLKALKSFKPSNPDHKKDSISYYESEGIYGDVNINYDGSTCEIKIRAVPIELAESILQGLNIYNKK